MTYIIGEKPKEVHLEIKCNGCGLKIKSSAPRETVQDQLEDGTTFTKTFCEKCVKEIADRFRAYLLDKEAKLKAIEEPQLESIH